MFDTQKIIAAFSEAWAAGDVDGVMALFNDDPVYRTSTGGGTGTTFTGRDQVRSAVERMTQNNSFVGDDSLETAEVIDGGYRSVVFWKIAFPSPNGEMTLVDGLDVFTFDKDFRIARKDAFRKAWV